LSERIAYGAARIGEAEIKAAISVLRSGQLSAADVAKNFESQLSKFVGTKYVATCNSGSSALLLSTAALMSSRNPNPLRRGDVVVTCATLFPTAIAPSILLGLRIVLVDADRRSGLVDMEQLQDAVKQRRPRMVILPHLAGNVLDLDRLYELDIEYVVEDCCDALGSRFEGRHVGREATLAALSFYPAHHITTAGEGGAVLTNDSILNEILVSLRDWGRKPVRRTMRDVFTYTDWGFNCRMTELAAAVGSVQLSKFEERAARRIKNAQIIRAEVQKCKYLAVPEVHPKASPCWMMTPIFVEPNAPFTVAEITDFLNVKGIECRPYFVGNIMKQPLEKSQLKPFGSLDDSDYLYDHAFFVGNHDQLTSAEVEGMTREIRSFVGRKSK
jgi:CDP-6-deoxy-D-xylo-4-hexulose-3-dehydrase